MSEEETRLVSVAKSGEPRETIQLGRGRPRLIPTTIQTISIINILGTRGEFARFPQLYDMIDICQERESFDSFC